MRTKRIGWLISKYLLRAIVPYFIFAWLLTSVILFVQQAGRYSDVLFNANIPKNLIWQLSLALIPNVIAFTCPMALLIGVIIGLSRMQGDSELTAVRSAGVGNLQILLPVVILGILLSVFTFAVNLRGVPLAAKIIRKVALQTVLYKLESPIEPGVFNTEISGYTIYVKNGDVEKGTWKNIFIFNENVENKTVRLITSNEGRIDSKAENSELVLENATVNTISTEKNAEKLVSETVRQLRLTIDTKRSEMTERFGKSEETPDELGLSELAAFAQTKTGKEKTEAQILWQRRIVLSITPVIFALLGVALILRFNRSSRGFGIILALASLIIHYLLTLLGEQLARTNQISVLTAGLIPIGASVFFIVWFFTSKKFFSNIDFSKKFNRPLFKEDTAKLEIGKPKFYLNFSTGILDFDITLNLLKYFSLTFIFLTFVYLIFTAFELWKFAGEINGGFYLLVNYLFYLLPFIYIQLVPSALMIATLATFVIKSRQNEIVTWTAAGQSIYRLLLPCFILMIIVGALNWGFQEKILPAANKKQDELRGQIRSRGVLAGKAPGRYWLADEKRIYSFEFDGNAAAKQVKNLSIYEFSDDQTKLQAIYKSPIAVWNADKIKFAANAQMTSWSDGKVTNREVPDFEMEQTINPFLNYNEKPSHLNTREIRELAENSESEQERKNYQIALEKKHTTPFLPFVITLFTAPFALSLSRKGRVVTLGYAVGIWLLFVGINTVFEQFGLNGFVAPVVAIWSPVVFFTIFGIYLMTRLKT